jgi:hypothetical protein
MESGKGCEMSAEDSGEQTIRSFRLEGFAHIREVITRREADQFREAALSACSHLPKYAEKPVFTQVLNPWRTDRSMK